MKALLARNSWQRAVLIGVVAVVGWQFLVMATTAWQQSDSGPTSGGTLIFSDDFERTSTGDQYRQGIPDPGHTKGVWKIEGGRLKAEKIHNAALWLQTPLPENVRVEFDARAHTAVGDVKCEIFGDGKTHQSGYILIHGGWHNTIIALARQDEHGNDRKEDSRSCRQRGQKRAACVEPNVDYHWTVERSGDTVRWYLDQKLMLAYPDADPVRGRFFAFNNWEAQISFDNLKIYKID